MRRPSFTAAVLPTVAVLVASLAIATTAPAAATAETTNTASPADQFGGNWTDTGPCIAGSYTVEPGITQVQVVAIGGGGQAGNTVTTNLLGGPADFEGGVGGLGIKVNTVISVHAGETLYGGVANSAMPGGAQSGDRSGGAGGAASWVSNVSPIAPDGVSCVPQRSSLLVVAAGGGGGGGAGAKDASTPGGNGGTEGSGGNGSNNKIEDGGGGAYPSTTGGSGGAPGHSAGCHGGQYGRGGSGYAGGDAADAGVDVFGSLGDCSEPPPTCEVCQQFMQDAFGGGGGAGGGGYWGGGGGGGADDSGYGSGGGGASGLSYIASGVGATSTSITSTRTTPIVQIIPVRTAPSITSADSVTFAKGVSSTFTATTTGANTPFVRFEGTLPAGITNTSGADSDDNGTGIAVLSGTPTQPGVFPLTVDACNDTQCTDQAFTLTVTGAPVFTSPTNAIFQSGMSNSFTVSTSAYPLATLTDTGLPKGLTFHDNGNGTATISGSPSATGSNFYTDAITATNVIGTAHQTITITVVTNVSITPSTVYLVPGVENGAWSQYLRDFTQQLTATATYPDGTSGNITNSLVWTSSNPNAVGVRTGLVIATALGTATISAASASSTPATASVVVAVPLSITVSPTGIRMMGDTNQQFTAAACYANPCSTNSVDISPNVVWSTGDTTSMQVTTDGLGTALRNATYGYVDATVTPALSVPQVQGEATITITHGNVVAVQLDPAGPRTVLTKSIVQYTPTLIYTDGTRLPADKPLFWSTADVAGTGVASAQQSGGVLAQSPGTATVMATYTNFDGTTVTGTSTLNVIRTPVSLIVQPLANPGNDSIEKGDTRQFQAVAHYADGSPDVDVTSGVTWTSNDPSTVSVSSTGLALGTGSNDGISTLIRASYQYTDTNGSQAELDGTGSLTLDVTRPTSIAITPTSPATLHPNDNLQFTAVGTYADGSTLDLSRLVDWTSLPTTTFTPYPIDDFGLLHVPAGTTHGTATVYAEITGPTGALIQSNSVVVTATDPLDHIVVQSTNPNGQMSITAGTSTPYEYQVTGFDSRNNSLGDVTADSTLSISPDGTCSSDDTCTATVADAPGASHTVTATDPNSVDPTSAGISLVVTRGPITNVSITGGSTTITAGDSTAPFHVTGTDNYGNATDLTNQTYFRVTPVSVDSGCTSPSSAPTCHATVAGLHTVIATVTTTSPNTEASFPLWVNPYPVLDHIVLSGGSSTTLPGTATAPYTLTGYDKYGNGSDITDLSNLSISPDGMCDDDAHTCTPATAGPHTVTAQNYAPTPLTSNALALTTVGTPTIAASFSSSTVNQGSLVNLSWTITNPNPSTQLTGIGFTATLPTSFVVNQFINGCGGRFDDPTGSFLLADAVLNAGASCTFTIVERPMASGTFTSVTTPVTSTEGGPGNTASATLNVNGPAIAALSFGSGSIGHGMSAPLSVTVTNPSATQALTGVGLFLQLPSGLSYANTAVTGSCGGAAIAIENGVLYVGPDGSDSGHSIGSGVNGASLAAGQSCTFSVNVTSTTDGHYTLTTSNVTSNEQGLGAQASTSVAVTVPLDHFDIQTTPLVAGVPGHFTITAEDASGAPITDYAGTPTITGTFAESASGCGSDAAAACSPSYALSPFANGVATATVTAYLAYYDGLITVTDGSVSSTPDFGADVTVGPLDHLTLTGGSTAINAGDLTGSYDIRGWDAYGNDRGDDANATLSISPDGTCGIDSCTAQVADTPGNSHVVSATDPSASHPTATSSVAVGIGPIVELDVSGGSTTVVAGTSTAAYTVAGVDLSGNAIPVVAAGAVTLAMSPDGTCDQSARTCTATTAGPHDVLFTATGAHVDVPITVTAAGLDHLVLDGAQSDFTAGQSLGLVAHGADRFGNTLSDATDATTFTNSGGSCIESFCTFTSAGDQTVTGTDGSATGTFAVHVDPSSLFHIQLGGGSTSISAGAATAAYTVNGTDAFGNALGDVTSQATLSISPDGTCSGGVCSASVAGTHQVVADAGVGGGPTSTLLDVTSAPAATLTITGGSTTVSAGSSTVPFYVTGHDAFGNYLGSVDTVLSISPDGHCDQTAHTCTVDTADAGSSFHTVTFTAVDGATASVPLTVTAGTPQYLVVSPNPATVAVNTNQAFTAEAFDSAGNDLGDVTAATSFVITGGGACTANECQSSVLGNHVVVANDGVASGTASMIVTGGTEGTVASLKLDSALPAATAGQPSTPYQVEGFDADGNDIGDLTNAVTLSISPDGTCDQKAHTCQSNTPDSGGSVHTVTATYAPTAATGTATLVINEAANTYDHLVLTPNPATVPAGTAQAYTAIGYDSSDEPAGDATSDTTFSMTGGSCIANVCTATAAGPQTVTGYDGSATGMAAVTVLPGAVDHIQLGGGSPVASPGAPTPPYTVSGYDAYGNYVGDVTASSTLSISPEGTCDQVAHTCTATTVDNFSVHTVTATDPGIAKPQAITFLMITSGGGIGSTPTVTGVSPASGTTAGGTSVTITGIGFTGALGVNFGAVAVKTITVVSDTTITVVAPAESAGSVDVTVAGAAGISPDDPTQTFTFVATGPKPHPTISTVSPSSGPASGGTSVVISGARFTGATSVLFGTAPATSFTVMSDSQIDVVAPKASVSVRNLRVMTADGTSPVVTADQFTYLAKPAVTGVLPSSGPLLGGTAVVINGSGFTGATQVLFGTTTTTSFTIVSDSVIDAVSPSAVASVRHVRVVTPRGTSPAVTADEFIYAAKPTVSSVLPSSGSTAGGTAVVLRGSGFTGATQVRFGTAAAPSFTIVSDTEIDVISPAAVVSLRHVRVVTAGGISPAVVIDQFTYVSASSSAGQSAVTASFGDTAIMEEHRAAMTTLD